MSKIKKETILHDIFLIGIIIKGIDGFLELIGGMALLFIKSDYIISIVQRIFQHELVQDSTDLIANYVVHTSHTISTDTILFIAMYLLIHGVIKLGLVIGLLSKKLWSYPLAGGVLSLFLIYQIIRIINNHSLILMLFTLIDIIILVLLRFEYKRLTHQKNNCINQSYKTYVL